jgi:hypothetical protein
MKTKYIRRGLKRIFLKFILQLPLLLRKDLLKRYLQEYANTIYFLIHFISSLIKYKQR